MKVENVYKRKKLIENAVNCVNTILNTYTTFDEQIIKETIQWALTAEKFKELTEKEVLETLKEYEYFKNKLKQQ